MSFSRRWLFTAAGTAYLASLARELSGATPPQKRPARAAGSPEADALFKEFKSGYAYDLGTAEAACREVLDEAYKDRLARIYPTLTDVEKERLNTFAVHLGLLTRKCLQNEIDGTCGWEKNAGATLRKEHVQRARELLGYHLNPQITKRCKPAAADQKLLQPDQGCPLCPP